MTGCFSGVAKTSAFDQAAKFPIISLPLHLYYLVRRNLPIVVVGHQNTNRARQAKTPASTLTVISTRSSSAIGETLCFSGKSTPPRTDRIETISRSQDKNEYKTLVILRSENTFLFSVFGTVFERKLSLPSDDNSVLSRSEVIGAG